MDKSIFDAMRRMEDDHWWFDARRAILRNLLRRHLDPAARPSILEMGCGVGGNLGWLSALGELTAVEYNPHALELAKTRGDYKLYLGGLPDDIPPEARGPHDLIVMLDVLEHIPDDGAALAALRSLLRPQGLMLLTVPAYPWLWGVHDDYHHHQRRYIRSQLLRQLDASGWSVAYSTYYNTLLFPLAVALRIKERLAPPREEDLLDTPAPWLNRTLRHLFALERHAVGAVTLPFGLSIAVIARKKPDER